MITRSVIVTASTVTALLLSGCGSSDSPTVAAPASASPSSSFGPAAPGPHNAQDVTFATDMVPHHAQAVEMADLALSREIDARVQALATQIKAAQVPEIAQMSGWLVGWDEALPSDDAGMDMGSHDMGGEAEHGMMSADEVAALDEAQGEAFARLFLEGMTRHHQGAVVMAEQELASGLNAVAKALAARIVATQQREILTMTDLLRTLA